jgi:hypothetical protein
VKHERRHALPLGKGGAAVGGADGADDAVLEEDDHELTVRANDGLHGGGDELRVDAQQDRRRPRPAAVG